MPINIFNINHILGLLSGDLMKARAGFFDLALKIGFVSFWL